MTEDKIKQFCRDLLQPVFDQLVDMQYTIISAMNNSLPKDLPDDQKEKLLKDYVWLLISIIEKIYLILL